MFSVLLRKVLTGRAGLDEWGVTSVEYALMATFIVVMIALAVTLLGTNLTALYNQIAGAL